MGSSGEDFESGQPLLLCCDVIGLRMQPLKDGCCYSNVAKCSHDSSCDGTEQPVSDMQFGNILLPTRIALTPSPAGTISGPDTR